MIAAIQEKLEKGERVSCQRGCAIGARAMRVQYLSSRLQKRVAKSLAWWDARNASPPNDPKL